MHDVRGGDNCWQAMMGSTEDKKISVLILSYMTVRELTVGTYEECGKIFAVGGLP